jgi:hypothetical protein
MRLRLSPRWRDQFWRSSDRNVPVYKVRPLASMSEMGTRGGPVVHDDWTAELQGLTCDADAATENVIRLQSDDQIDAFFADL